MAIVPTAFVATATAWARVARATSRAVQAGGRQLVSTTISAAQAAEFGIIAEPLAAASAPAAAAGSGASSLALPYAASFLVGYAIGTGLDYLTGGAISCALTDLFLYLDRTNVVKNALRTLQDEEESRKQTEHFVWQRKERIVIEALKNPQFPREMAAVMENLIW